MSCSPVTPNPSEALRPKAFIHLFMKQESLDTEAMLASKAAHRLQPLGKECVHQPFAVVKATAAVIADGAHL